MPDLDRQSAHLVLAAIRVLAHRQGRSPTPDEVAELLELPPATVRLYASQLQELGAAVLVESAYEVHLEIRDHRLVDDLEDERSEALAEDLADFDRRKQAENERMARLFDDGTFAREREEKLRQMDEKLRELPRKPKNPFE
ncbi:hypothetical protein GF314_11240 [bacterium]|nr:hypothetical protein [bacterium]